MEKYKKTSISLPPKVYNKARIMADEMGLPLSPFLSVLIIEKAKEEERKERKK